MPTFEVICDCCMETQPVWTDELETRDCPLCGVGKLLGPWPVKPRFHSDSTVHVVFPLAHKE
jgi:hypothetical protein